jgi:LAGLIDADG DNA endonuclease family
LEGFGCSPIKGVRELGSLKLVTPLVLNKDTTLKHIKIKYSIAKRLYYSTRCFSNANNQLSNSALPSKELDSILIGLILSDAGLYRSSPPAPHPFGERGAATNTSLEMSFGQAYKEFAYFIGELLSPYATNPVKSVDIKVKDKVYTNYRLKTKTLPLFNHYFDMFYKLDVNTGKYFKIVPENIKELMDPIVLAYLIMGDGNFDKGRNRVRIYTNSFIKQEVEELALSIKNNLGIYTGVLYDRKDQ